MKTKGRIFFFFHGRIVRLIAWYLNRVCGGASHVYPYGKRGRYVVLINEDTYEKLDPDYWDEQSEKNHSDSYALGFRDAIKSAPMNPAWFLDETSSNNGSKEKDKS